MESTPTSAFEKPEFGGLRADEVEFEDIDLDAVRRAASTLLEGPISYVPIRHHSPTCALIAAQVIREKQPAVVLVEGPPSFDDQIELLLDPSARMPLAIYSHVALEFPVTATDDFEAHPEADGDVGPQLPPQPFRIGSYFPLCDYSPELAALRAGRAVGAELGFADLDYEQFARFGGSVHGHANERRFEFSTALRDVAAQLGCRDHNELWDQMVEGHDADRADLLVSVLTYGTLARAGVGEDELRADGTAARELAMAQRIVDASATGPVVVVTGAFHSVALPELVELVTNGEVFESDESEQARPTVVDRGHGLIRYSFDRLDALSGYGAGMPSPRWYQSEWEHRSSGNASDPASELISEVANELRTAGRDGQPSLPSVVDAFVATEQLHLLRNRSRPTRADVVDAMVSCFTKGEDSALSPVRQTAQQLMTGHDLGAVPPQTPRVPLALDFDRLVEAFGMPNDSSLEKQLHLDVYRSERDRRRSRFMHGLVSIGVVYGSCITPLRFSSAAGRDVIRERWAVRLSGATDVSLTEASVWGASITEAVAAKTRHDFEVLLNQQPSAVELMQLVMVAAQRGVPDVVAAAINEVRLRVSVDPSLVAVIGALAESELLWSAREPLGGAAMSALPAVAEQLYVRACQLGGRLREVPESEQRQNVEALATLHRIVHTEAWNGFDDELFWSMLDDQHRRVGPGMIAGALSGLMWRGGRLEDAEIVSMAAGHLDAGSDPVLGAEFVDGLILVARDVLWEVEGLVAALCDALESYEQRQFLHRVPGLRSAFSSLTPRQTDRFAESIMERTGGRANVRVAGITENQVLRHVTLSASVAEQLTADGLDGWVEVDDV